MRVRFLRWLGLLVLVSAIVAVATLPFPPASLLDRYFQPDEGVRAAGNRLRAVQSRLQGDLREFRATEALQRGREIASRAPAAIVIDRSVPEPLRAEVDSLARVAWTQLGHDASPAHAGIIVYFDSVAVNLVSHLRETNRPLEVTHALPEATGSERCLTIVRLRRETTATIPAPGMLLGPCAFHAVFGVPGPRIREWLGARDFAATVGGNWSIERVRADERTTIFFALGAAASACLASGGRPCRDVLAIDPERREPVPPHVWYRAWSTIVMPRPTAGVAEVGLLGLDRTLLADMVRDFGETRFRAFWTSSAAPDVAFREAMGVSLEDWTRRWLRQAAPVPGRTAVPGLGTVLWLAVALPLLTMGAVRPRQTTTRGGGR